MQAVILEGACRQLANVACVQAVKLYAIPEPLNKEKAAASARGLDLTDAHELKQQGQRLGMTGCAGLTMAASASGSCSCWR